MVRTMDQVKPYLPVGTLQDTSYPSDHWAVARVPLSFRADTTEIENVQVISPIVSVQRLNRRKRIKVQHTMRLWPGYAFLNGPLVLRELVLRHEIRVMTTKSGNIKTIPEDVLNIAIERGKHELGQSGYKSGAAVRFLENHVLNNMEGVIAEICRDRTGEPLVRVDVNTNFGGIKKITTDMTHLALVN